MFHITTACTALTSLNPLTFFSTLPHWRWVQRKNIWSVPKKYFLLLSACSRRWRWCPPSSPRPSTTWTTQASPTSSWSTAARSWPSCTAWRWQSPCDRQVIVILMAGTMTSPCWRTITWPWHSNSSRTQTVISSSTSPRSRGRPSGKWL